MHPNSLVLRPGKKDPKRTTPPIRKDRERFANRWRSRWHPMVAFTEHHNPIRIAEVQKKLSERMNTLLRLGMERKAVYQADLDSPLLTDEESLNLAKSMLEQRRAKKRNATQQ